MHEHSLRFAMAALGGQVLSFDFWTLGFRVYRGQLTPRLQSVRGAVICRIQKMHDFSLRFAVANLGGNYCLGLEFPFLHKKYA